MLKYLTLSFFIWWNIQPIYAQFVLKGQVIDQMQSGIPFANVLLLNSSDSVLVQGVVTDMNGYYLIDNVTAGKYLVAGHMMGFKKVYHAVATSSQHHITIPSLILEEDVISLQEVVVEGEKPLFEQTIDRMVVNVQSSPIMAGNSVIEVLEKSPGITVDRQNFGLGMNGKNDVSVMVNGRMTRMDKTALFGMLEGMSASTVEKIELIATPPANFDAEGEGGFINIVLKKNNEAGMNGGFSAMAGRGRRALFMTNGNINYRQEKFNVFADLGFNYNRRNMFFDVENQIADNEYTFHSTSRADRHGGFNLPTGRLGLDLYLSEKTVVGVLGTFFYRDWSQRTNNTAFYTVDPGVDTLAVGTRIDRNPMTQNMINFNLQHQFDERQKLNLDLDYFVHSYDQFQSYTNEYFLETGELAATEEIRIDKITPIDIVVGKVDYTIKANDQVTIESGIKTTLNDLSNEVKTERLNDDMWVIDPVFSNTSQMEEDIHAVYTSLSTKINDQWSIKAGLRYEHTITDLRNADGSPIVYRDYGNLFPSLFLNRSLSKNSSLNLSYSNRIRRPSFADLAPFVLFIEPRTFYTGNTNLLPEQIHAFKVNYSLKSLNISLEYSSISNSIAELQPSRVPGTNTTILSSVNMDKRDLYNLNLSFPVAVTQWWEMDNNISGFYSEVNSQYFEEYMSVSNLAFSFRTNHRITLPHKTSLEVNGMYFSGDQSGIAIFKPYGMFSLGMRKDFGKNGGSLSINFTDVFRTMVNRVEANAPQFNLVSRQSFDFDVQSIRLTYKKTFGNNELRSRNKRQTGSADDLRRVGG